MTPEDEKRLAEIRDLADEEKHCRCPDCDNRRLLLAKLDEEKRARTEAEATIQRMRDVFAQEHDVRIAAENALAEEREATRMRGVFRDAAIARAEAAEARVAELEGIAQSTASGRMREERDHYRALLLKAQNRIIELEAATAQQKGAE